jgi:ligand-binding SRPBCC domain-containing protein
VPGRLTRFERDVYIARSPAAVFDFCCQGENLQKISPERITPCADTDETVVQGDHVYVFRHWMNGVFPVRWEVHIVEFVPGERFVDLQLRGPFRYYRHAHVCRPSEGGTRYADVIEYATVLGAYVDRTVVRRRFASIFAHRQRMMKRLLECD